jgi:glutamyl-tRNA synthetase
VTSSATDLSATRVRFCPSPTGNPHVGVIRTALFNWAWARHTGGTFVFRIEDTDSVRDTEESYLAMLEALRWLGLDWDEGPEVGGPHGPYRQSQRLERYADIAHRLVDGGYAYHCYCTPEELDARRELARSEGRPPGYDGHCRELTAEQVAGYEAEGREPATRLRMPDHDWTWDDHVRGEITFGAEHVTDYVLVRGNGEPLYTLTNPIDDVLMEITDVLRGEDLLSSTPRQLALYEALFALGLGTGHRPRFGHLPYVMGEGNRKLSKRDPEASLDHYRRAGFLPEGLLNYLALLGWSPGEDREFFSMREMADVFELSRVNPNPARFDVRKATAINADWVRHISADDLTGRLVPYLQDAGLLASPPAQGELDLLARAVPLVQERMEVLAQAVDMLGFLFVADDELAIEPEAAARNLGPDSAPALEAASTALRDVPRWDAATIEAALRSALVDGLGLKPKVAFGPVRTAVTGRRVSPPLFESLELLGRESALARLAAAGELAAG